MIELSGSLLREHRGASDKNKGFQSGVSFAGERQSKSDDHFRYIGIRTALPRSSLAVHLVGAQLSKLGGPSTIARRLEHITPMQSLLAQRPRTTGVPRYLPGPSIRTPIPTNSSISVTSSSQPGFIDDLEAVCLGRFIYCPIIRLNIAIFDRPPSFYQFFY